MYISMDPSPPAASSAPAGIQGLHLCSWDMLLDVLSVETSGEKVDSAF